MTMNTNRFISIAAYAARAARPLFDERLLVIRRSRDERAGLSANAIANLSRIDSPHRASFGRRHFYTRNHGARSLASSSGRGVVCVGHGSINGESVRAGRVVCRAGRNELAGGPIGLGAGG